MSNAELRSHSDEAIPPQAAALALCRLCEGGIHPVFHRKVLERHEVGYFRCASCGSLQTETPYWLDDAYATNLSSLDTGAAHRNLLNLGACYWVSRIFKLKNVIDFGGGDGLLCRLLRDYDINCFVEDKYAAPTYAMGYTEPDFATPDMVVAFEVLEHFAEPKTDLDQLFRRGAKVVLASTEIFYGFGSDWWYLAPESGQHVFFYTKDALALVAERYGYRLAFAGMFILFIRADCYDRSKLLRVKLALKRQWANLSMAWVLLQKTPGIWTDHLEQKARSAISR